VVFENLVGEALLLEALSGYLPSWTALGWTAALGLLILYPTLIIRRYIRITMEKFDDHTPHVEGGGGEALPLRGTEIRFAAADGHPLNGVLLHRSPGLCRRGVVLFCHEFGSDRTRCVSYCRELLHAGFDVLAFDFRGHGESPAEPGYRPRHFPTDREVEDVRGAIAHAREHLRGCGAEERIGLFGLSRGAAAAVLAAADSEEVRAIVTDSVFSSDMTVEFLMRRFATSFARIRIVAENHPPAFWRFMRWLLFIESSRRFGCSFPSVRQALSRLGSTPLLMIHGEKDRFVSEAQARSLYSSASGPKSFWLVPGARHNQAAEIAPDAYHCRVVEFFSKHFPEETARKGESGRRRSPGRERDHSPRRQDADQPALVAAGRSFPDS